MQRTLRWAGRLKHAVKQDLSKYSYYTGRLIAKNIDATSLLTLCYRSQALLVCYCKLTKATIVHQTKRNCPVA